MSLSQDMSLELMSWEFSCWLRFFWYWAKSLELLELAEYIVLVERQFICTWGGMCKQRNGCLAWDQRVRKFTRQVEDQTNLAQTLIQTNLECVFQITQKKRQRD
ncbi:Hypothetical_protein [Hexamita inflata]|uniref:Hypothetical_protein n=1 Tax=Hexamita inflata TaxID=28002 RepID=A0AA86RMU3_9EUKA|nr:Hypothetical protein HINF_LOCUS62514 [Hexamita inflata]